MPVEMREGVLNSIKSPQGISIEILGVRVDLVDYDTTIGLIKECISRRLSSRYICASPVHPIMVSQWDQELKDALNYSWLTVPDGMPVVWAARCLGAAIKSNVRGTELMLRACEMAERNNYSVFLYGGKEQTLEKMKINLLERYQELRIVGVYSPPFRALSLKEETKINQMINTTSPDILFVALGAPKQEKWMANHCERIKVPVTIGVGAAFDFLAGEKKQAPVWMQAKGLEWLHRLCKEPTRLLIRYVFYNPLFVFLFSWQLVKTRIYLK